MNDKQIEKLASMLDPSLWKNPLGAIKTLLQHQGKIFDPRKLSHVILRGGTELTKDDKKKAGINPNAKTGSAALSCFTDDGLKDCVDLAFELALAIATIDESLDKQQRWKRQNVKRLIFAPAPDCCDSCKKLEKEYPVDKAPIPVLDTHLGCRCSYTMGANCFD